MDSLRGSVIYHVFIDRFAGYARPERWNTPEYIGGNLQGITHKLAYIKDLGANVIWLSPFYKGIAYHGYHITDFYQIDPHFGTEADLKQLVQKAHQMGLKVVADFVPNHCSVEHPFFKDAQAHQTSPYRDWFIFDTWPHKYRMFLHVPELAKLNLDNPKAAAHLQGAARKWLALGLDGFRLDHVVGLSRKNLTDLLGPLRQEFPKSLFFGEAWIERKQWWAPKTWFDLKTIRLKHKRLLWLLRFKGSNLMYRQYVGVLDGVTSFKLAKLFEQYANATSVRRRKHLEHSISRQANKHLPNLKQFTFLDNHDTERFLFRCGGDKTRLKRTVALQLALKQPAVIYYGSEIGMTQDKPFGPAEPYADLLARKPMEWDESKWDKDLHAFYREQIWRRLEDIA